MPIAQYPAFQVQYTGTVTPTAVPVANLPVQFDMFVPTDLNPAVSISGALGSDLTQPASYTTIGLTGVSVTILASGVVDPTLASSSLSPPETILGIVYRISATYVAGSAFASISFRLHSVFTPVGSGDPWSGTGPLDRACVVFNFQVSGVPAGAPIIPHSRAIVGVTP